MISIKDFTIIIPSISYKDVKKCIQKIRLNYKKIKIIVCLNKLNIKKNNDKNLTFVFTKKKPIGKKRNLAVNKSKTKYLAFIDSDAYPGTKWIESSFKYLAKKNVGIVAGPHIDPLKQSSSEQLIGLIKKSFLITIKPNLQKKKTNKPQYVNFLPSVNWVLSKSFFNLMGQMDNEMLRNEDWDFVYRMRKEKIKVFYSPKSFVYHENSSFCHFLKKRFLYGFHMWPILLKLNSDNYYFIIPLLFVIFLLTFPLTFYFETYYLFYFFLLSFYFCVIIFESIRISNNLFNLIKIPFLLTLANILPGCGIFFGIFKFFKK